MAARAAGAGERWALFGAPYDGTVSYRAGARFGPARIREASYSLEEYSLRFDATLDDVPFADWGDVTIPFGDPARALDAVAAAVADIAAAGRIPVMLGGEHLLTLAAVRALAAAAPGGQAPAVVQFDAHADTRDDYLGDRLSHATVMRRVAEVVGPEQVYQLGIRSGSREEIAWSRAHVQWLPGPLVEAAQAAARRIGGRPLYLTIDIDVLDPSVAPGTGTPEPAGVDYETLLAALKAFASCRIIGLDLVEVAPPLDPTGRTEVTAASLVRDLLLLFEGSARGS